MENETVVEKRPFTYDLAIQMLPWNMDTPTFSQAGVSKILVDKNQK